MAKPIRATPTLRGNEAVRFLRGVLREERYPSKERVDFIRKTSEMKFNIEL